MKAKIIAVLGAVALGLTASASAQTTDYTPVSFNLTGTYLKVSPRIHHLHAGKCDG